MCECVHPLLLLLFARVTCLPLDNFIFDADLEYVDHQNEEQLILVNTTCAILLNGAGTSNAHRSLPCEMACLCACVCELLVLHLESESHEPVAAPAVLLENEIPYVPFEDCVILYMDLEKRSAGAVFGDLGHNAMRKMLGVSARRNIFDTSIAYVLYICPLSTTFPITVYCDL